MDNSAYLAWIVKKQAYVYLIVTYIEYYKVEENSQVWNKSVKNAILIGMKAFYSK